MAVRKARSVDELPDTGSIDPASPQLGRVLADVWHFNDRLARTTPPRGVRKFKTLDEANRHRAQWEPRTSRRASDG